MVDQPEVVFGTGKIVGNSRRVDNFCNVIYGGSLDSLHRCGSFKGHLFESYSSCRRLPRFRYQSPPSLEAPDASTECGPLCRWMEPYPAVSPVSSRSMYRICRTDSTPFTGALNFLVGTGRITTSQTTNMSKEQGIRWYLFAKNAC